MKYQPRYHLYAYEEGEELKCEHCKNKFYIHGEKDWYDTFDFKVTILDEDENVIFSHCKPSCAEETIQYWNLKPEEFIYSRW